MKMKRKIFQVFAVVLSAVLCFGICAEARTVIELTDEERESGKTLVWDWYNDGEASFRRNIAFARTFDAEGWNAIKEKLIWTDNGQLAHRTYNFELLVDYFDGIHIDADSLRKNPHQILGDLNGNGSVDVGDARIALRLAVGLEKSLPEGITFEAVDLSLNDNIDVEDARLILRGAVGLEELRATYPFTSTDENIDTNDAAQSA